MKTQGFILTDKLIGGTIKRFQNDKSAQVSEGASQQIKRIFIAQDVFGFKEALSLVKEIHNKHEHLNLKVIYREPEKKNVFQKLLKL